MRRGRVGEVYNFGAANERTNLEIVHGILEIMAKPETLIRFVSDRPGHDRRYAVDATKARRDLGWEARIGFDEGLRETVRWYTENGEWVRQSLARSEGGSHGH